MFTNDIAGTERLASSIGNGGLEAVGMDVLDRETVAVKRTERDSLMHRVMDSCQLRINNNRLAVLYGMTQADSVAEHEKEISVVFYKEAPVYE